MLSKELKMEREKNQKEQFKLLHALLVELMILKGMPRTAAKTKVTQTENSMSKKYAGTYNPRYKSYSLPKHTPSDYFYTYLSQQVHFYLLRWGNPTELAFLWRYASRIFDGNTLNGVCLLIRNLFYHL